MRKFSWLFVVIFMFTSQAQPAIKNLGKSAQILEMQAIVSPTFGGQWAPSVSESRLKNEAVEIPTPALVSFGAVSHVEAGEYFVPVLTSDDAATASMQIEVDDVVVGGRTGGSEDYLEYTGKYSDSGQLKVRGAGEHAIHVRLTFTDGKVETVDGTYTIPACPQAKLVPLTREGSERAIFFKGALVGSNEMIDPRSLAVVYGFTAEAVESWDIDNPNYKAPEWYAGKASASRLPMLLNLDGTFSIANARTMPRNSSGFYKMFAKTSCGNKIVSPTAPWRLAEFQAPPKAGAGEIQFTRDNVFTGYTFVGTKVSTLGKSGNWFLQVVGTRKEPCPYGGNFYFTYQYGSIMPGQESIIVGGRFWLPKEFNYEVFVVVTLDESPFKYEYFIRRAKWSGQWSSWECWNGGKG